MKRLVSLVMAGTMMLCSSQAVALAADTTTSDKNYTGYVLMNIPYSEFYAAEINNTTDVDVFTSATVTKAKTPSLSGGSYHQLDKNGNEIVKGLTFPVYVTNADLSAYTEITDSTPSVSYEVTGRGNTTTVTLEKEDLLYEQGDYAYYKLTETPAYYKKMTVSKKGVVSFGKTVAKATSFDSTGSTITTDTSYGDYQITVSGIDKLVTAGTDDVYAVVMTDNKGTSYGLRVLENFWRVSELAVCTGHTDIVHGCPTSDDHYKTLEGRSITSITYYTSKGVFTTNTKASKLYATPYKTVSVSAADANTLTVKDLPSSAKDAKISVYYTEGQGQTATTVYAVENAALANGKVALTKALEVGKTYTVDVEASNTDYVLTAAGFTYLKANTLKVSPASKTLKAADLQKKAASLTITAKKAVGKVTYKSSSKSVTVSSKGKVTVKKGTKAGTYKVTVTAAGDDTYASSSKTVTIKVK